MSVRLGVQAGETADMHEQRPHKPAASTFAIPAPGASTTNLERPHQLPGTSHLKRPAQQRACAEVWDRSGALRAPPVGVIVAVNSACTFASDQSARRDTVQLMVRITRAARLGLTPRRRLGLTWGDVDLDARAIPLESGFRSRWAAEADLVTSRRRAARSDEPENGRVAQPVLSLTVAETLREHSRARPAENQR